MRKITLLIAVFLLTFCCFANKNSSITGLNLDSTAASSEVIRWSWSARSYDPQLKLQQYFSGEAAVNLWNALDVLLLDPACAPPTALLFDGLTHNSARITWTGSVSVGAKYDVYYSTVATVPTVTTVPTVADVVGLNTTLNGLANNTTYFVWVRSSCSITTGTTVDIVKGDWLGSMSFTTFASIPYTEGFESINHGFEFGTGAHVNRWYVDTAVKSTGLKSLYISRDNGVSHLYNLSGLQVTHASKKIIVPAGTQDVSVSFDWICKGDGFLPNPALDYFKVWVVPETFVPTTGTLISTTSGGVLLRAREFNNNAVFLRENLVANLNQFAGQTVKLVFEWRNDATDGNQPPAAIDNIDIKNVTCVAPTNLATSDLTENSVRLNWTGITSLTPNYEVYYTSDPNPIIYDNQAAITENITANRLDLQGLTPNTKYYAWVRTKCAATNKSFWVGPAVFTTGQVPQQLPYVEGFEGTHGWNLNSSETSLQTNKWAVGAAVNSRGTKSLYVSRDAGTTYEYTLNQEAASHAYRDIQINTGVTELSLSFDWKCFGEGFTAAQRFDYFRIWMVPIDFVPASGTPITAAANRVRIGTDAYNNKTNFTRENIEIQVANLNLTGQRGRLVFEWINNRTLGNQPPAAIDNIDLRVLTCAVPTTFNLDAVTRNSAKFRWNSPMVRPSSYELFHTTTQDMPITSTTPTVTGVTSTVHTITGLTANTVYYVWLRSSCGTGASTSKSYWIGPLKIITTQVPGVLPYSEDFEQNFTEQNTWTSLFSDNVNKWVKGTAATAGVGNSMYISNNDGANHAYTLTRAQVSHLYRDISIPANTVEISVAFDWKSNGEGTLAAPRDFLRVWLVPTEFIPVEGVRVSTAATLFGGVQVGLFLNNNAGFVREISDVNVSRYAGRDMRLLFEWVNDNAGGNQPPAAIDNVGVKVITCPKVKDVMACVSPGSMEIFWKNNLEESPAEEWQIMVYPGSLASGEPDPLDVPNRVVDEPVFVTTTDPLIATYTVYVRAICQVDENNIPIDTSIWVKKIIRNTSYDVGESNPFCAGEDALIFPNVAGPGGAGVPGKYGAVGCLNTTPNPVWYFLKIRTGGDLNFRIIQDTSINFDGTPLDVDYISFGPFADMREACATIDLTNLNASRSFSCSYSGAAIENFNIPRAEENQIYVLLITNYVGTAGFIKLEQVGGTGVTDCSFNCEVNLGKDRVLCDTDEYEIVANVSTGGDLNGLTYTWFKDGEPMDPATYNTDKIIVTESGKYKVVVDKVDCKTPPEDEVEIKFVKSFEGTVAGGIDSCDPDNDGVGAFDLKILALNAINTDPNPNKSDLEYTFYNSIADAGANIDPIAELDRYESVAKTVFLKIKRKDLSKCEKIVPVNLVVKPTLYPVVGFKYPAPICINNDMTIAPELISDFDMGGTFSSEDSGLSIHPKTGVIDVEKSAAGKYVISYTYKIPSDKCGETTIGTTEIEIFERFQITYDAECSGGEYKLRVVDLLQNVDMNTATYAWAGSDGFKSDKREIVIPGKGEYNVLVTTTDGCYETLRIELDRVDCMIPKGISPNGDGINDSFDLSRYVVNNLTIFNRYGKKVYSHGIGYTNQWTGQSDSGSALPDGTYFYEIVTSTETFTGWIQINK